MKRLRAAMCFLVVVCASLASAIASADWNMTNKTLNNTPKSSITVDSTNHYLLAYAVGSSTSVMLRYWTGSAYADTQILAAPPNRAWNGVSVAVEPGSPDRICVGATGELSNDVLTFQYVIGHIGAGYWVEQSSAVLDYPQGGGGAAIPNAMRWFNRDNC
ncbi:MAG: hypothetical protein WC655_10120, partial [Candidatus Hydrogenedentales bacterium]